MTLEEFLDNENAYPHKWRNLVKAYESLDEQGKAAYSVNHEGLISLIRHLADREIEYATEEYYAIQEMKELKIVGKDFEYYG